MFTLFFKTFIYIKYFYYLHDGDDDDDEMSVVELIEVELPDDNNNDTGA